MGSAALDETDEVHEQVYPGARRSSVSSECSSRVRFSRISSVPAWARMFSLAMLALILTCSYDFGVGAVNFAFNGFNESDVYVVPDSSWTLDSSTSSFYLDSVVGRFLYPGLVQMTDPISKKVKPFSTSFIYQLRIPPEYDTSSATGPGMAFIIVPDNVTVGAPLDFMGLLTANFSSFSKNCDSDNHTLGVELDTYMNIEFNDPGEDHIGINLASMNSTYTCTPTYNLASRGVDTYRQIWIDYFENDSRMDIAYAYYGQGKPDTPQGSQRGLDLSFFIENMYIGFSSARGRESDIQPYVLAWSFSNDGLPAPPIVIGLDVLSASIPSSPGLQPPASAPAPVPSARPTYSSVVVVNISVTTFIIASLSFLICWWKIFRRPLRIFISHAGDADGSRKYFPILLLQRMTSRRWWRSILRVKIFMHSYFRLSFSNEILRELARCDVGVVVVSRDYFQSKWPMQELVTLTNASKHGERVRLVPLFYELAPHEVLCHLESGTWELDWYRMSVGTYPLLVDECREAVRWLCMCHGIVYGFPTRDHDKEYTEGVLKAVDKILCEERSFATGLQWTMTGTAIWGRQWRSTAVRKRRKGASAPPRATKEIDVIIYVQKQLHLLFALSGQLMVFFSVILDNHFNDQPERFIAFAILAPILICLGILASGWFPRLPLWVIACLKRRGFLPHVSACSPWHDNVVTDYCGEICTLELLEQAEGTAFLELHQPLLTFLYCNSISPQRTTLAPESQDRQGAASTLERPGECLHEASTVQSQNEDLMTSNSQNYEDPGMSGIIEIAPTSVVTGLPNFQEAPSPCEAIIVPIDHSSEFYILNEDRVPTLTFEGPMIRGYSLKVQVFKNTSSRDPTFDLTCSFRNKRTRRMFLTTQGLQNLAQNMYRWVENPYPIVTDESSDILHCLAIEDILWEFTKGVYSFRPVHIQHRYLAGLWKVSTCIVFTKGALWIFLSMFPLLSERHSYYFLLILLVLVPNLCASKDIYPFISYKLRELLCPVFIYKHGFNQLYLSGSSYIWCDEFRQKRIVNPTYFWIDGGYSNKFLGRKKCFDVIGFVNIPDTPIILSFNMICRGRPDPNDLSKHPKQHDYALKVRFDNIKQTCYTGVDLSFYENKVFLEDKFYPLVEIRQLYLIEKLFHSYTDPSFGGYVEKISPGFRSRTYLAHCPRFLDICDKIIKDNLTPLIARRATSSNIIIGVPF